MNAITPSLSSVDTPEALVGGENCRRIIQTSIDGFWIVDTEGRIVDVNDALCRMLGYRREELLQMRIPDIEVWENRNENAKHIERIAKAGYDRFETRHRRKNGDIIDVEVSASFTDENSGLFIVFLRDITARKRAKQRLAESESLYKAIFENAVEGILIADVETTTFKYANPAMCRLLGYGKDDLATLSIANIHPEQHLSHVLNEFRAQADGRKPLASRIPCLKKDGTLFYADVRATPITVGGRSCVVGFFTDLSESIKAQEAITQSRLDYQRFFARSITPIFLLDPATKRIEEANPSAVELTESTAEELIGKPFTDIMIEDDLHVGAIPKKAEEKEEEELQITRRQILTKTGDERIVDAAFSYYVHDGKPMIQVMAQDVTEKAQAEARKEQLIHTDRMVALGTLVSGVAHEINNPNNFVMLNAPILRDAWDSTLPILDQYHKDNGDFVIGGLDYSEMRENISPMFDAIENGSVRIKNIVADLKSFARVGPDDLSGPMDINDICKSATSLLQGQIKKSTRHFIADFAPDLPPATGNAQRIGQVIINLLQNSCQSLSGPDRAIKLMTSYVAEAGTIRITVSDQGAGMPKEVLEHATDPFYTTKRDCGGTGLGLSVSLGIVRDHGGTLSFSSKQGRGTTAVVILPLRESERSR